MANHSAHMPSSPTSHHSETSPLLSTQQNSTGLHQNRCVNDETTLEGAGKDGKIQTNWVYESKILARYSRSSILAFLLQYSLNVVSIVTVGHLGKIELGAASLGYVTASISGYAIYTGLASSLDTLCAQAYGSGKKEMVGLHLQRMFCLLWLVTIPIGIFWLNATWILQKLVPEQEVAAMTGAYLKVLFLGAPGYGAFESGKRYMQAQGLFDAALWVLLIGAPLNALLNWLFVWKFQWGFLGSPMAVAITNNFLPLSLFLYACFINGRQCWHALTWKAFRNWGPMIRLALPGLLMIEAEFSAFEVLALVASQFSATHLAAQSVIATVCSTSWSIPFSASTASSTRVANLIGAMQPQLAQSVTIISLNAACVIGIINTIILATLRNHIPKLFTHDPDVTLLVSRILLICASFQLFDSLAAICNGVLRGLGRQKVGAWVGLFCWYGFALPFGVGTAFGLHWELYGLLAGVGMGLCLVVLIELWVIYRTDWDQMVDDAVKRNSQE